MMMMVGVAILFLRLGRPRGATRDALSVLGLLFVWEPPLMLLMESVVCWMQRRWSF